MAGAVQNAVIALNLTGEGQVSTAVDKVNVNLTAAERSGKKAESASKAAESAAHAASRASHDLAHRASHAVRELRHAVHLLERLSKAAGLEEGSALGIGLDALSSGAQSFRVGNALFGPLGGALAFGASAISTAYQDYTKAQAEEEKKKREEADRAAEALARALERRRDHDLEAILRDQAGLRQLAAQLGGVRTGL